MDESFKVLTVRDMLPEDADASILLPTWRSPPPRLCNAKRQLLVPELLKPGAHALFPLSEERLLGTW